MQKVILDTNVIVSALIQKSFPHLIVFQLFTYRKVDLCISNDLLKEYFEVLTREKFARFPDFQHNASLILKDIQEYASMFNPTQNLSIIW